MILLVEDDVSSLEAMQALLHLEGYLTRSAINGPAAIATLEREPADAIIMDLYLPGMDGRDVLAAVRSCYPAVPVLVLSAASRKDLAEVPAGVEVMQKPVVPERILAFLAEHQIKKGER